MKPIVSKIELKDLSSVYQKKVCSHKPVCKEVITFTTFNDGMMMCDKDARSFGYEVLASLKAIRKKGDSYNPYKEWTVEEEKTLIQLLEEKGIYHGVYREIAEAMNRTRDQVKWKSASLRKRGLVNL